MTTPTNSSPYLPVQKTFPQESQPLSVELSRSYVDIAQKINSRTIGLFAVTSTVNGERWNFNNNSPQQGQRQVYVISGSGSIAHGLNISAIYSFVRIWGVFTNGTNWYPLPYVDVTNVNNQISLSLTPSNIVITSGAGSPPSISSGVVVLEWIG